jgi:Phosphotransferase enzyme family
VDVAEAEAWVRSCLPGSGPLERVQTEPWASVFRVRVDGGFAWFKACATHQAFEVPLTAGLSERWREVVTEVVAYDAERRWFLAGDAGEPLRTLGNPPERWLEVLPRYAEIQIGETGRVAQHLASGVPDLRTARLPGLFDELLRAELPISEPERSSLDRLLPRAAARCEDLDGAGIAPSIQHDDLHMNNVYAKDGVLRVLDWGDASIGHPFFSLFETFRFLGEMNGLPPGAPWFARLRDVYLEPWGDGHRGTFDLALRVAGLAHAVAWLRQREALALVDRPAFDETFAVILRLALDGLVGGSRP